MRAKVVHSLGWEPGFDRATPKPQKRGAAEQTLPSLLLLQEWLSVPATAGRRATHVIERDSTSFFLLPLRTARLCIRASCSCPLERAQATLHGRDLKGELENQWRAHSSKGSAQLLRHRPSQSARTDGGEHVYQNSTQKKRSSANQET